MDALSSALKRVKDSSLSERLVALGVVAAGAYFVYRRYERKYYDNLIASWKVELTEEERQYVAFIFHLLDRDHNLALDKQEFRRFVEATPQISSLHKNAQLNAFRMLDSNEDGMLSLPEFENFFKAIKNMAGKDIAEQLLEHFVSAVRDSAEGGAAAGSGPLSKTTDTSSNESTTMIQKRRATVKPDNEFEKKILADLILPKDINVSFKSIGSLDKTKQALRELVIYPLKHPELFKKGMLAHALKGILLFGPPGTGKTMLAKAVATECGASFINISASSIGSKWYGESEKYAKAVFSVARKMAPSVVFIDEIDSLLQQRGSGGSVLRSVQTTLMTEWDGLATGSKRVMVLGATNRPFDLDEAILRRMPRRLLVDVPDQVGRQAILKRLLADDVLDKTVDLEVVAKKTAGFTGSDLKVLCHDAAFIRVREMLKAEEAAEAAAAATPKSKDESKGDSTDESKGTDSAASTPDAEAAKKKAAASGEMRPIRMKDFTKALKTTRASISDASEVSRQLREWNDQYGDNGAGEDKQRRSNFLLYT